MGEDMQCASIQHPASYGDIVLTNSAYLTKVSLPRGHCDNLLLQQSHKNIKSLETPSSAFPASKLYGAQIRHPKIPSQFPDKLQRESSLSYPYIPFQNFQEQSKICILTRPRLTSNLIVVCRKITAPHHHLPLQQIKTSFSIPPAI